MMATDPRPLQRPSSLAKNPRVARWVRFEPDGAVSISSGKVELGQGILGALAQIAAEELDVDPARIRMLPADTSYSPDEGVTSGSLSIQDSGTALRHACATARHVTLQRVASLFQIPASELRVEDGTIRAGNHTTSYWGQRDAVGDSDVDLAAPIKPHQAYRVVGSSTARPDLADKMIGRYVFMQDLRLAGMLYGRVVRPTRQFSRLISVAEDKVPPGVLLVRDGDFVGVLAEREELAIKAMGALRDHSEWADATPIPQDIHTCLRQNATEHTVISEKNARLPMPAGARKFAASYDKPYISHAPIGPSCAAAQYEGDHLTVWTHSQGIFNLRRDLSLVLEIPENAISVRHVGGSGCYGHNGADDVALDAALLARAAGGRPVQVQWMRDDEFGWAPCGPAMTLDLEASVDAAGQIVAWRHELWSNGHSQRPGRAQGSSLLASWHLAKKFERPPAVNAPLPMGAADRNAIPLYEFPNQRVVNHYVREAPIRASALRSLGAFANVFAIETFMDDLAVATGTDPVAFRLRHLGDPRARAVVEAAAQRAGWTQWRAAEGRGHGMGFARYKNIGAYCAVVAEIEAEQEIRLRRLVIGVDVGLTINPDGVKNQIEGGAIQAASWALREQVRFNAGGITSLSWDDYPILRFSECPDVEIEVIDRPDLPSLGAGEAVHGPTAAAIGNAVRHALGVSVRELPLTAEKIAAAIGRS
jgi:CO/xanthine dehydrogenase Mo-binding subunit